MTLARFQAGKYGSCIVSAVCICARVWLCVSVWTIASSMDAPAKHRLLWRCQETVAFLWRQTAPIRFGRGFSLRLSIRLPPLLSLPLSPAMNHFFFPASSLLLPVCLLLCPLSLAESAMWCGAVEAGEEGEGERGKDGEENVHQSVSDFPRQNVVFTRMLFTVNCCSRSISTWVFGINSASSSTVVWPHTITTATRSQIHF